MALPAKKVSLILIFSAASFFYIHAGSMSYSNFQSIWEDREHTYFNTDLSLASMWDDDKRKYQTYMVYLSKHPNGVGMDDNDARRRWYESFLPSTLTDSGEPRLLDCYPFEVNGFLASLTREEAAELSDKPGVRNMLSDEYQPFVYSRASCGTSTTRRFARSRMAFSV